jgi:hypothetical protein
LVPELALPNFADLRRRERAQAPTVAFADASADSAPIGSGAKTRVEVAPPAAAAKSQPSPTEFLQRGSNWQQIGEQGVSPASGLSLDGVGISPAALPSARRPASRQRARTLPPGQAASAILQRLRTPLKLLASGALIAAAAWVYFVATGELVRVGPVGPFWIAGPLVVAGLVWLVLALFREQR